MEKGTHLLQHMDEALVEGLAHNCRQHGMVGYMAVCCISDRVIGLSSGERQGVGGKCMASSEPHERGSHCRRIATLTSGTKVVAS